MMDTFFLFLASLYLMTKSRLFKTGKSPKKSKISNSSYISQISIAGSLSTIWTFLFHWYTSPRRAFSGSLTLPVIILSTSSRKHSSPLLFSLIGFLILNSLWKLILWTMLSLQFFPLLMKKMKFIWSPFTPGLSLQQSWTMTHITRNYLPFLKLLKFSDTTWKV